MGNVDSSTAWYREVNYNDYRSTWVAAEGAEPEDCTTLKDVWAKIEELYVSYHDEYPKWEWRAKNHITGQIVHYSPGIPVSALPDHTTRITISPVKGDMKAGLTNDKPELSQLPYDALVYTTRAFEYGASPGKYERGNFLRRTTDVLADYHRLSKYLDAALRHITATTTSMLRVSGTTEKTEADLRSGAFAQDPESGLPHLCHALASLMMGVQQAVDSGLLPAHLGRPWEKDNTTGSLSS